MLSELLIISLMPSISELKGFFISSISDLKLAVIERRSSLLISLISSSHFNIKSTIGETSFMSFFPLSPRKIFNMESTKLIFTYVNLSKKKASRET